MCSKISNKIEEKFIWLFDHLVQLSQTAILMLKIQGYSYLERPVTLSSIIIQSETSPNWLKYSVSVSKNWCNYVNGKHCSRDKVKHHNNKKIEILKTIRDAATN